MAIANRGIAVVLAIKQLEMDDLLPDDGVVNYASSGLDGENVRCTMIAKWR